MLRPSLIQPYHRAPGLEGHDHIHPQLSGTGHDLVHLGSLGNPLVEENFAEGKISVPTVDHPDIDPFPAHGKDKPTANASLPISQHNLISRLETQRARYVSGIGAGDRQLIESQILRANEEEVNIQGYRHLPR